jgi:transcriptional regulator with XRE-family HTH domain
MKFGKELLVLVIVSLHSPAFAIQCGYLFNSHKSAQLFLKGDDFVDSWVRIVGYRLKLSMNEYRPGRNEDAFPNRRKMWKVSQIELGEYLGVSQPTVNNAVRGVRPLDVITMSRLAVALNVDPAWLMGFDAIQRMIVSGPISNGELRASQHFEIFAGFFQNVKVSNQIFEKKYADPTFRATASSKQLDDAVERLLYQKFEGRIIQEY